MELSVDWHPTILGVDVAWLGACQRRPSQVAVFTAGVTEAGELEVAAGDQRALTVDALEEHRTSLGGLLRVDIGVRRPGRLRQLRRAPRYTTGR